MNNYICTYFFYEKNETGSTYGNIFLPIKQRNIIYWQTIYTFYFTAIVINKNNNSRYAFFTNEKVFTGRGSSISRPGHLPSECPTRAS